MYLYLLRSRFNTILEAVFDVTTLEALVYQCDPNGVSGCIEVGNPPMLTMTPRSSTLEPGNIVHFNGAVRASLSMNAMNLVIVLQHPTFRVLVEPNLELPTVQPLEIGVTCDTVNLTSIRPLQPLVHGYIFDFQGAYEPDVSIESFFFYRILRLNIHGHCIMPMEQARLLTSG